jgi:hypothetical protein
MNRSVSRGLRIIKGHAENERVGIAVGPAYDNSAKAVSVSLARLPHSAGL